MSYTNYVAEAISEKIVLVEIDVNEESIFLNKEPGIWFITYHVKTYNKSFNFGSGAFGFGAFGTAGVADLSNGNPENVRINSFYAGNQWYTKASSLSIVRNTDKSFYFDNVTSLLYVHLANFDPPNIFDDIRLGVSHGFSDRIGKTKCGYYDDIYYDPRVISVPAIGRSKDPLFFGKISFDGGTIALNNADGEFDTFQTDYEIYGCVVRILLGFEDIEYSSFKTLYEGYIENLRLNETILEIQVNDKRKQLSRSIPTSIFDTTTYPFLNSSNSNKPIPLLYGSCDNVPIVCTNEDQLVPASYSFKICDTTYRSITAVDVVRVNGVAMTASSINLSAATFALSTTQYIPGETVTADIRGYASGGTLIENGLEILRDILANHFGRQYDDVCYNTAAWGSAESVAANLAIFIEEPTEGWKSIEEISSSLHGNFIVQDNGRFSFRAYDATRPVDQTIYYWELLDPILEVASNTDEILSSCRIKYDKDWDEETFSELRYYPDEAAIAAKFKAYREQTFETLLTAAGSATTFAAAIMAVSGNAREVFRARTKLQSIDRELSDIVSIEYKPENRDFVGWMTAEVIGKTINLDDMTVELTLRKIV